MTAVAAMLCAAFGSAILLAMVWRWLGGYGNILFAGTIVRGLLIGALLAWVCKRARFSKPVAAATIAALATLLAIVGAHYETHTRVRAEALADAEEVRLISSGAGSDPAEVEAEYERARDSLSFVNYLRGYYGFEGQAKDGTAALWGPWAGLALYAMEIAAAMGLATLYPLGQAGEPICRECARWREEQVLGCAAHGCTPVFLSHLLASETKAALDCLAPPDTAETLVLSLARCSRGHDEGRGGVLRVRDLVYDSSGRNLLTRDRGDLQVDQHECDAIIAALETWA